MYAEFNRVSMRCSAVVNATRLFWIDAWLDDKKDDDDDDDGYRSEYGSDDAWLRNPPFVDRGSARFDGGKNADETLAEGVVVVVVVVAAAGRELEASDGGGNRFGKVFPSRSPWPSESPLVIWDPTWPVGRSFSVIVRTRDGEPWEFIEGSSDVFVDAVGSRGMFVFVRVGPAPE